MNNKYYKPLPQPVTIKESKIEGLGLFAIQSIPIEINLGVTHIIHDGLINIEDDIIRTQSNKEHAHG